jgi:short-subunit dehydrogenase involved in D-alanine esterification of teichoic acids
MGDSGVTIAIRGFSSSLAQAIIAHLPAGERAIPVERGDCNTTAERHLFCQGILRPLQAHQQTRAQREESFEVNCGMTIAQCNKILAVNDEARICIIGSESGFSGSFDDIYAAARAGLHHYVQIKKLRTESQQLICIAPAIIEDSRMTRQRQDTKNLAARKEAHPKRRFLLMDEVCVRICHELYVDRGYTSNTIIRMHGGSGR